MTHTTKDARAAMPRFWYTTYTFDGKSLVSIECYGSRDEAFDAAEDWHRKGEGVIVTLTQFSDEGLPVRVADVTAAFFVERGLDPDRYDGCDDCGQSVCRCDDGVYAAKDAAMGLY